MGDALAADAPQTRTREAVLRLYDGGTRTISVSDHEIDYPDGKLIVSRTDLQGLITHVNQPFVDMSGWTREELIGQPHNILRHPDMPEWQMTPDQAQAISAYIMSLGKPGNAKSGDSPADAGYGLLVQNCARCHSIGTSGNSPLAKAPPFREVVKRYDPSDLEEALAEGITQQSNEKHDSGRGSADWPAYLRMADKIDLSYRN